MVEDKVLDGSNCLMEDGYKDALNVICKVFCVQPKEITNINDLTVGMTNRSFTFRCQGKKYIFRNPGQGTGKLINRSNEYDVYRRITKQNICDHIVYFDVQTGYKITQFIDESHNCDANNIEDVTRCIRFLRQFHNMKLTVNHYFDVFKMVLHYESLFGGSSRYPDYEDTKAKVFSLERFVESVDKDFCLTHIDAVPDNFILTDERVYLIDWEYAAMQDPHIDIAMFAIYSMYNKEQIDRLIDIYFEHTCAIEVRRKIYCYVSICGLLWSNWCEYKSSLGEDFGEYALKQYLYAKDFYNYFMEESSNV